MSVTLGDARRVGDDLAVNWDVVSPEAFQHALGVELEHKDVTHGDLDATARIVLAHLREAPDYYERLAPMEKAAEEYWSLHNKPSPTLGGGISNRAKLGLALLIVLAVVAIAYFGWRYWKGRPKEGLAFPPFVDALGYETPVPGDPGRNILRRSRPYPPGRYPEGGLHDFYFSFDPAYSTAFETDYCWHAPAACAGFALEPFRPAL